MGGNNEFFENFERNKYLKKLPSMQRIKTSTALVKTIASTQFIKVRGEFRYGCYMEAIKMYTCKSICIEGLTLSFKHCLWHVQS